MGRRSDGFSDLGSTLPKQTFENLQPIKKNSYQEPESVANRPQSEIDNYFAENRVSLIGNGTVRPIMSFEETTFPGTLIFIYNVVPFYLLYISYPLHSILHPQIN